MTLAAPVSHPDHPEQELLRAGYVLEPEILARLADLAIPTIFVEFPGLDDLDKHLAVNLSPARQKIYTQIKQAVSATQRRTRPAIDYENYYSSTRDLITTILFQGQNPVYLDHLSRLGGDAIAHSTAVAQLSLMLGIKLENYIIQQRKRLPAHHAKEIVNLGVAAMMHDMGKMKLPEELQQYNSVNLPPEDKMDQWKSHTSEGYEMVRGGLEPSAAAAVMHHHQRWDGNGFPVTVYRDGTRSCLESSRIHIFARILATANLYDRLITPSTRNEPRRSNLEAFHLMRTEYATWYDPAVFRVLQVIAPPFPPGSILTLSDTTQAVVVDVDPANPYRPVVKRIVGDDMKLDETKVELRLPGMPSITHIGRTNVEAVIPDDLCPVG
jgi:HD-GYP domain-containing protein (c-di-GMP phosphodiesterase class II)